MNVTVAASELQDRVRRLIVERLKLEVDPLTIDPEAPLFGEGLGLDSIDALEIVLGLEQEFGVKVGDQEMGAEVMASVNTLVEFVRRKLAADA